MGRRRTAALGALAVMPLSLSGSASAGGTLGLDEVLEAVAEDKRLVAEIKAVIVATAVDPSKTSCVGARFGSQWENLSGGRSVPFYCQIGDAVLTIEGKLRILDHNGREILLAESSFKRATSYRATNFRWRWLQKDSEAAIKAGERK